MQVYKSVQELSREQLGELKYTYFWSDDYTPVFIPHWRTGTLVPVLFPSDIPDEVIFEKYKGISFVNDDFACTAGKED